MKSILCLKYALNREKHTGIVRDRGGCERVGGNRGPVNWSGNSLSLGHMEERYQAPRLIMDLASGFFTQDFQHVLIQFVRLCQNG